MAKTLLTPKMEKYFVRNAFKLSEKAMAKKFNVSVAVVKTAYRRNKIIVPKDVVKQFRIKASIGRTNFTKQEDKFIKENYLTIPIKTMATILNRSGCGITGRMRFFNLVVPKELAQQRKENGMFRTGQIPINKGKKQTDFMNPEAIERTKATRFKKGETPHNALKDFEETIRVDKRTKRKYTLVKLPGQTKLVYKHIHIYETHFKLKIQKGFNVVFKDGNTQNFDVDNLEHISDSDLMKRNSYLQYPKEIAQLIQLKGALTRQINRSTKKSTL